MDDASEALTPRERAMVDLAGDGLSRRDIAVRLGVSLRTVRNDLTSATAKLREQRNSAS
jgi:two-component system, NarL family, response regulator DevR